MKVAGIGKTNIDLVYSGMPRAVSDGEELYSEGFEILLGGGYPATLGNLSNLNIETTFVTYLGKDMFSSFGKNELDKQKIETINLYDGEGIPVNVSTVMITPNDRAIATYTTDYKENKEAEEVAYETLLQADVILIEALAHLDVYRKLKEMGKILILDTGWDDELSFEKYGEYVKLADYYTPNSKEAMKLTGKDTPEQALYELGKYFDWAVVKLDKDGVLGLENGKMVKVKSIPHFKCIDSTGAGDNFLAGFTYGVVKGMKLENALLAGCVTGGKCVTEIGCFRGRVSEEELLDYVEKYQELIVR